jgi:hypothetical protein
LPVLVLRFEAQNEEQLDQLQTMFRQKMAKYPEISSEWETG